MILPQNYLAALLVSLLGMICWGMWANTYKMSRWRFELYYFDFALGMLAASVILAFTTGSMGFDGFTFMDDLMHSGKRQWFYSFVGGIIFNLGNMLLMAAIALSGMGVAFPIALGIALIMGVVESNLIRSMGAPGMVFGGCAIIFGAIIAGAAVNKFMSDIRHEEEARAGKAKSTRRPGGLKGVVVGVISGILLGSFYPLLRKASAGDLGLGPYAIAFLFALGVFFSTFVFNLFFMNLPVQGEPVDIAEYFRGGIKSHVMGWMGGGIWILGAVAAFTAANPNSFQIGPPGNLALIQASTLVAALCGVLIWKEYGKGDAKVQATLGLMLVLYAIGLGLISSAPLLVHGA